MTRYYKKENVKVETVERYTITKIGCNHCKGFIEAGEEYNDITLYPDYAEIDVEHDQICDKCLLDYIKKEYLNPDMCWSSITIDRYTFNRYDTSHVDTYEDKEDVNV